MLRALAKAIKRRRALRTFERGCLLGMSDSQHEIASNARLRAIFR